MLTYNKDNNTLSWNRLSFSAVSGPHGKGALPNGYYHVHRNHVVTNLSAPYTIGKTSFFIPLSPLFPTERSGFGIHPDGNTPGTLGCIGLVGKSVAEFWEEWNKVPMIHRPKLLLVGDLNDIPIAPVQMIDIQLPDIYELPTTSKGSH